MISLGMESGEKGPFEALIVFILDIDDGKSSSYWKGGWDVG